MAAKLPVLFPRETSTVSLMAFGFDPRVSEWSPYHGAQTAVLSSLAKIVCMGGKASSCRLSFQEFFGRAVSGETWGRPAAALLGAIDAQIAMGTASIGGKDSMSGTFENLNVPNTLVSFAVTHTEVSSVTSGAFKSAGDGVYIVTVPYSELLAPDFATFSKNADILYELNRAGKLAAMYPVCAGGIAEAVTKMAAGNRVGVRLTALPRVRAAACRRGGNPAESLFVPLYGAVIAEAREDISSAGFADGTLTKIGVTTAAAEIEVAVDCAECAGFAGDAGAAENASGGTGCAECAGFAGDAAADSGAGEVSASAAEAAAPAAPAGNSAGFAGGQRSAAGAPAGCVLAARITIAEAEREWESTLSGVFPQVSGAAAQPDLPEFAKCTHSSLSGARRNPSFAVCSARPRVLLPVFPGTNCEYDMARAFALAGAEIQELVFRNNTPQALSESLSALEKELKKAQILALSGGFSAGDEPDGSGKFIANVLRESRIAAQIMDLLKKRGGLVLGICNGFQALIKTGLVPYGEIRAPAADMPTLTFNLVGRHISRVVRTRMVSAASPWAQDPSVIDPRLHLVPVSHGEGRVVIGGDLARKLFENGQIFSQYADESGAPATAEPDNPNGSLFAIEGMTSPDGHVLGKMGHSERTVGTGMNGCSEDLIKNVAGNPLTNPCENSCQNIFAAGVRFFR